MKPNEYAGYRVKYKNSYTNNYNVVLDCKLAEQQGSPIVEDWKEKGGRYQVLCDKHSFVVYCPTLALAKETAKDSTNFCDECRELNSLTTPNN